MSSAIKEHRAASTDAARQCVGEMRTLAVRALARMYRPDLGLFAFRIRRALRSTWAETRRDGNMRLEGISPRYTAIVLIGLADQDASASEQIFGKETIHDVCDRLLNQVGSWTNLGDCALTLWAANRLGLGGAEKALRRVRELDAVQGHHPTVEVAWALTGLSINPEDGVTDAGMAANVANRLLSSFSLHSELFPHWPRGSNPSWMRAHVCCYADLVYPIQALSHYHRWTRHPESADAATRSARRMCALQGRDGQWWWHYDVRTGRVVEGYPVYAVHQNSMGPMALFALEDACGVAHHEAIRRGLQWLIHSPEINGSLIDRGADVIWRKVARHEPGKLVRAVQGGVSRVHPGIRIPGLDAVFAPGWIDFESRPYHMGWILHAWGRDREDRLGTASTVKSDVTNPLDPT